MLEMGKSRPEAEARDAWPPPTPATQSNVEYSPVFPDPGFETDAGPITEPEREISDGDPLLAYSKWLLSRREAVRRLGLRDCADLLVALGYADLPMPLPPAHEIENQAATFAKLCRAG